MKAPAFQFYTSDWLSDLNVQLMSLEEEGCYIRLLSYCWQEGALPANEDALSRLGKGASTTVIKTVVKCFAPHPEDPEKLIHRRLETEREKQAAWRSKSVEGGKRSAANRCKSAHKAVARVVQPKASQRSENGNQGGATLQSSSSSVLLLEKEAKGELAKEVIETWNSVPGFTKALQLSEARRQALSARLKDKFFVENWQRALEATKSSQFHLGASESGWTANLDWFLRPDTVLKIIERERGKSAQFTNPAQPKLVRVQI